MKDKVLKRLEEMEKQAAYFNEQLLMTRGAIQILQALLTDYEDGENEISDDQAIQVTK